MRIGSIQTVYVAPRNTLQYDFCCDLDIEQDGRIWRDAMEFVMAGPSIECLEEFWSKVREEYLSTGGRKATRQQEEVVFE